MSAGTAYRSQDGGQQNGPVTARTPQQGFRSNSRAFGYRSLSASSEKREREIKIREERLSEADGGEFGFLAIACKSGGAVAFNRKFIEITQRNVNTAFDPNW